ncbi:MAG: ABC transporter substrate-binding protein [Thermomicrobiales bacterium]|nr:ABC transporter substrate-binding protein [Thermomicrobiales bacterium]
MDEFTRGRHRFGRAPLSRRRALQGAAGALALSRLPAAWTAPAAAQSADPALLVLASYGSPVDLDPHSAAEDRSALVIRAAYEPLSALAGTATDAYDGVLAERWDANADSSVWTFHLRPGVHFHDGAPCDAEAVRLSFERLLTLQLAPAWEFFRFLDDPSRITAPDPATVVFDLGRPWPQFELAVSSQYGAQIVNARRLRELETDGDWGHGWAELNAEGLGTGPYRIVRFEPGQSVELTRFDDYWRGWEADHFERLFVRVVGEDIVRRQLIETGEAHIADLMPPAAAAAMADDPAVAISAEFSTEVTYCMLTVAGPLASPAARQAMCYAFPYDEVIDGVFGGFAKRAIGSVAEITHGFDPATFTYHTDLAKAKELFAAAGVPEGTQLRLMIRAESTENDAAAQLFQANLAQIGIALSIEAVDYSTLTGVIFRDVDPEEQPNAIFWSWWPAYNDAWDHLQAQVVCTSAGSAGTNGGYYCNPRVDELMAEAADAADEAVFLRAMAEVQQIVSRDDPAAIYYTQRQWITAVRRDVVGFAFNPIYIGTYDFYALRRGS